MWALCFIFTARSEITPYHGGFIQTGVYALSFTVSSCFAQN